MITYIRPEDRVNAKTQPRDINENYSLGTNYGNPNVLTKTPKPVIQKTIGPVNKTQIGKPMTYEMDSTRKSDLKKMYNSNPTLKKKFKTFELYLQQFFKPLKK
jgi:hypothetical protein